MKSKLLSLKKIKNEYSSLVLMAPYTFLFIFISIRSKNSTHKNITTDSKISYLNNVFKR